MGTLRNAKSITNGESSHDIDRRLTMPLNYPDIL